MAKHTFHLGLTGGEIQEPIIRFTFAREEDVRHERQESVFRILKNAGFVFVETKFVGPYAIPEICDIDHHFEALLGKIIFVEDRWNEMEFILANAQPGVLEHVAAILENDENFQKIAECRDVEE